MNGEFQNVKAGHTKRIVKWLILAPLLIFLVVQIYYGIQVLWFAKHNPESTSFMRLQESALQEKEPSFRIKHQWVDYPQISDHLKRAVIASEDDGFVEHEGVDWDAMQKAYEKNKKKGKVVAGGSTITQQLAKNLFFSPEKSYFRKGEEVIVAYMLEASMEKDRILEIYLNSVEWGVGVFGAEAAAQHYFGVSAKQLTPYQAAKLAVMLPKPRYYDKNRNSAYLNKRTNIIVKRMGYSEIPE